MKRTVPICFFCCRVPVIWFGQVLGLYFIYRALRLLMHTKYEEGGVIEKYIVAEAGKIFEST